MSIKSASMSGSESQLSSESREYLRGRPKSERSPLGQFLTPRVLREALVSKVPLAPGMKVLDPGVGTGEFLLTCLESCPEIDAYGWDIDQPVLDVARKLAPSATLASRSALDPWPGEPFDVVIGNPPYYEMRNLTGEVKDRFAKVISGRPNIFALFFYAGWEVLKEGGYLAYVVPPSMNNGAYFDRLRDFLLENFSIEHLDVFTDPFLFDDAQTAVQLIVLKKGSKSSKHWVDLGELSGSPKKRKVFVSEPRDFKTAFKGRETLRSLGFQAVTGTVVWNTRRDDLCQRADEGAIPLIWAHNITQERTVLLQEDHPKRPQYVRESKALEGPAIVVNRITGSVGAGSLRCALVPEGMRFVAENHVNVVIPQPDSEQRVSWDGLLSALRSPEINERIRTLTGNTQVSATELTNWVPLDI